MNKSKRELEKAVSSEGFDEVMKKKIVDDALTTASQVLMTAIVMTNSERFISGTSIFPNGEKWTIKFEREN